MPIPILSAVLASLFALASAAGQGSPGEIPLALPPAPGVRGDAGGPGPSGVIRGRLVDPAGRPASSAPIELYRHGAPDGPERRARSASATGRFRFSGLDPLASYVLVIPGPGCLAGARRELVPAGQLLETRVDPGSPLAVRVLDDATGAPLSSADVLVAPPDFPLEAVPTPAELACLLRRACDAATGVARFEGLAAGRHRVAARAPGFAPAAALATVPAVPGEPLTLRLSREGCAELRIVDARTGEPVEGARIAPSEEVLENPGLRALAPPERTDATGRARLCVPPRGGARFVVDHDLYAPRAERLPVDAPPGERVVLLERGGSISGVVRDERGDPEPGVSVCAPGKGRRFEDRTDGLGRYLLGHLPAGRVTVARSASAGGRARTRSALVAEGARAVLDFGPAVETTLRIMDGAAPVGRTRAIVRTLARDDSHPGEADDTETDEEGRLRAQAPPGALVALDLEEQWVFLRVPRPRDGAAGTEGALSLPARSFSGRLVDPSRASVRDAIVVAAASGGELEEPGPDSAGPPVWLSVDGSVARSGADGQFRLRVPAGVDRVLVILASGQGRSALLPPGDEGEIVLDAPARLRLRATGAGAGASLVLGLAREGQSVFARTGSAPADGSPLAIDAEPGRYTIVAWSEGRAPWVESGVEAAPASELERDIALVEGGSLRILFRSGSEAGALASAGFLVSGGFDWSWLLRRILPVAVAEGREGAGDAPAQAVVSRVPPGTYRVRCPSAPREARVADRAETVVDCR